VDGALASGAPLLRNECEARCGGGAARMRAHVLEPVTVADEVAVSAAVPVTVEVAVCDPEDVSELVPVGEPLLVTAAVCEGVKVALSVAVKLPVPVCELLELDVAVSVLLSLLLRLGCNARTADSSHRL